MAAFRKTTAEIARAKEVLDAALAPGWSVDERKAGLDECQRTLEGVEAEVGKLRGRAAEKDPEKALYGPKMVAKVEAMAEGYDMVRDRLDDAQERVRPEYESHVAAVESKEAAEASAAKRRAAKRTEEEEAEAAAAGVAEAEERAREAAEAEAREEAKRRKAERAARREVETEERRERAAGMSLSDACDQMKALLSPRDYKTGLGVVHAILSSIVGEPADPKYRHVRVRNEALQRDLVGTMRADGAGARSRRPERPLLDDAS